MRRRASVQGIPLQRACREGVEILDEELEIVRADGQAIHELCRATPLRDEEGGIRGCLGIFLDITARTKAEAALRRAKDQLARANQELETRVRERTGALVRAVAEREKLQEQLLQAQKMESVGTLAGGIAHDFNNILNIIKGYVSLLGRSADGELAAALKVIEEATERGASIVRQLLAIARKTEARFERVDLNAFLERLAELLRQTLPKTIEVSSRLDPGLPSVMADPNQINQALLNLCVNARDAMPEGGRLLLESRVATAAEVASRFHKAGARRYACVGVIDTGLGMEETVRSRIFEPFFTTKGQGTGLGLAVVYGIVTNHSGFIGVSSRPGAGSSFHIYLPLPEGEEAWDLERRERLEPGAGRACRGETLLLVEDEIRQLQLMQRFLEGEGYRVLTARDGLEAVEVYEKYKDRIALVILDLGLPKLNGWEAFQKMKQANPKLKVILATGYLSSEVELGLAKSELNAVVMKPYQVDEVLRKIAEAVNQPQPEPSRLAGESGRPA